MSNIQKELIPFSRALALLFNRATIYHSSHPYMAQTIDNFHPAVDQILKLISPLVFILNGDQFFLDEEPLPAGTNAGRIVAYFKKTGIHSVSFESGIDKNQIRKFLEVFTSSDAYPEAEAMRKALLVQGVKNIKINHVFFKKVTVDDEIVSQDALKGLTLKTSDEEEGQSKKAFVDLVLGKILAEELKETLTLENLLKDPAALSKKMTDADLAGANSGGPEGCRPGMALSQQLEMLGEEVEKKLVENGETNLPEIAAALFEMKKRLLQGMEAQKSLNISYSNEKEIVGKADEITDTVVLQIVRDEYKGGKTSPARLAQIARRLIPQTSELKRLLPKIRSTLMEEGMALTDFLRFVQELGKELESEELADILQDSSEAIGIDGNILMEEIKKNPVQAAELIYLAAEIRKGAGDEKAMTDLLVDYAESLGTNLKNEAGEEGDTGEEDHLRKTLTSLESGIVEGLKSMDFKGDLLDRLEARFNDRIEGILEQAKLEWISSHSRSGGEAVSGPSVLELLEKTISEGGELSEILQVIRGKVDVGEIDKDNFAQIYTEITKEQTRRAEEMKARMPKGFLEGSVLAQVIEKEIARANRYTLSFSALSFAIVKATAKSTRAGEKISYQKCTAAIYQGISQLAREADIIGELGRNKIAVLLPMTSGKNAQTALKRYLKALHTNPIDIDGIQLQVRVAGVAVGYDFIRTPDAASFIQTLSNELAQMERRMKNLQAYF
jgi:molybdenum-dependent DNA-binding transcriptional regulator ModE